MTWDTHRCTVGAVPGAQLVPGSPMALPRSAPEPPPPTPPRALPAQHTPSWWRGAAPPPEGSGVGVADLL